MDDDGLHVELGEGWQLWRRAALRSAGMPFDWLAPLAAAGLQSAAASRAHAAAAVRELVLHAPLREALTWQNPAMMRNWVADYAAAAEAGPDPPLRRRGQREPKLAHYFQRYCAKNDTIGFFGPVAWADLGTDGSGVEITGTGDVVERTAYLESWLARRLAARWAADARVLPHLPVRLDPASAFDGTVLHRPLRAPADPGPVAAAILAAVDGRRTVADVLAAAGQPDDAELRRLRDDGVLRVGFPVPIEANPEVRLGAQVARLPESLRAELGGQLDALVAARDAAAAAGPVALLDALTEVDRTAAALTGPVDRTDRLGRTPVYLDARRDLAVRVSRDALDRLAASLGLLLDSARWFVDQVADELVSELGRRYKQLQGRHPGRPVTLADVVFGAADVLAGAPGTLVHAVADDFAQRWQEILGGPRDAEVRLTPAQAAPLVAALFPAGPRRSWAAGRYQSPDLMLGHLDGLGQPLVWVLGELHLAFNGLENRVFVTQCDRPAELVAAAATDLAAGRILPVYPVESAEVSSRTYPPSAVHVQDRFAYWSWADDDGHPSGEPSVAAAGVVVREEDGELVGVPMGASWRAPLLEFLGEFATALVVNRFGLRGPGPYSARVRIGDLVVERASWRLPAGELAPDCEPDDHRFRALADRLRGLGVPRHAFYRTPAEPKPAYVDLQAPLLLRGLADAVRRAGPADPVHLVEMLPDPEQLWLTDAGGRRFTSELRAVAVDTRPGPTVFLGGGGP